MKGVARVAAYLAGGSWFIASIGVARAQSGDDAAAAEALFAQGSALVASGRYEEGCPKLERAQQLVKGIGVTLYVGACYERRGELLRAWEQFKAAEELAASKGDSRRAVARDRIAQLWPRLAKLEIVVPAGSASPDLAITDGEGTVPRAAWGTERPVEPGVHRIRASAPDRDSWEISVEIRADTAAVVVEVPPLRPVVAPVLSSSAAPMPPPPGPTVVSSLPPPPSTDSPARRGPGAHADSITTQRLASFALLGVGAIGVGVGIAFGFDAKSKMDDSNSSGHCKPNDRCDATGLAERSDALSAAGISTGSFVVAAGCVLGGIVLYLTSPRHEPAVSMVPRAERNGASLFLERAW